jgi:hypothetical protein
MKRDDRTKAMDKFREDPQCEVLLVSLRAGGVGLNLTMASRVYLMVSLHLVVRLVPMLLAGTFLESCR